MLYQRNALVKVDPHGQVQPIEDWVERCFRATINKWEHGYDITKDKDSHERICR